MVVYLLAFYIQPPDLWFSKRAFSAFIQIYQLYFLRAVPPGASDLSSVNLSFCPWWLLVPVSSLFLFACLFHARKAVFLFYYLFKKKCWWLINFVKPYKQVWKLLITILMWWFDQKIFKGLMDHPVIRCHCVQVVQDHLDPCFWTWDKFAFISLCSGASQWRVLVWVC